MGANAKAKKAGVENELREPTDFGEGGYVEAQVLVTNACNLECSHCFVFREDNPNSPRDKMDDANMLHQLRLLRDKHGIKSMLFVGGEPMIRKDLVFEGMKLFDKCTIVTNGTYGIPSVPGHVVVVSLDGPEGPSDAIRGEGVFQKVKQAIFERDPADGTSVIMQMVLTRQNEEHLEAFVEEVKDWPISGLAFTFYVPNRDDRSSLVWRDLRERDRVVERLIALKRRYPRLIKSHVAALEMMMSDVCMDAIGENGEKCQLRKSLPLYMGENGRFERTFCCYGNDVDCERCGAYMVFNQAYHLSQGNLGHFPITGGTI
ncbi:MAG TPA: radical SAM protein [Alphaproteobacteria bacterium]|jgi:MoaA/NifB/PqqE/SkfB family radical SAM enzyme|nr:radical SAM protein [Alphaproteobacteria bacterium]